MRASTCLHETLVPEQKTDASTEHVFTVCMTNPSPVSNAPDNAACASDSIDSPSLAVLELFGGPLRDVRFPNIDAESLDAAADDVVAKAAEVQKLREALLEAQDELREAQAALRAQACQGHAYAKIYASGDEELCASLEAISFEPAKSRAAKKPRGRKAKAASKTPQLRLEGDAKKDAAAELERAAS